MRPSHLCPADTDPELFKRCRTQNSSEMNTADKFSNSVSNREKIRKMPSGFREICENKT